VDCGPVGATRGACAEWRHPRGVLITASIPRGDGRAEGDLFA
jgi:hypothetical protein